MRTGWQSVQHAVEAVTLRKTAERRRLFADPVGVQGKSETANTATKIFRLCAILESLCVNSGLTVRNRGELWQISKSCFGEQRNYLACQMLVSQICNNSRKICKVFKVRILKDNPSKSITCPRCGGTGKVKNPACKPPMPSKTHFAVNSDSLCTLFRDTNIGAKEKGRI